jgi:hypothetical protein
VNNIDDHLLTLEQTVSKELTSANGDRRSVGLSIRTC